MTLSRRKFSALSGNGKRAAIGVRLCTSGVAQMITAVPGGLELLYFQINVLNETYSSYYAVG
jgi:hypothetical protein